MGEVAPERQDSRRVSGRRDCKVRRWNPYSWDRVALGLARYAGSWRACLRYLVALPWFGAEMTNRFARGTLSLQDELGYRSSLIPAKEAWELFPGIEEVETRLGRIFPDEGSSVSYREMVVLCSIIRHEKARTVFEIGTSLGVTTFNIALNLPEDGIAYTLDLPCQSEHENRLRIAYEVSVSDQKMIFANRQCRRFLSSSAESKVTQLYGDSATFDYAPYHGRCDVVFVDGAHSMEYVRSDTQAALRLAKPGGLVVWHDYNDGFYWPDVHRYLNRLARDRVIYRVRRTMFALTRV
jgi:predicted O-methyltransferase YrrM